jgi:hypothetical protein
LNLYFKYFIICKPHYMNRNSTLFKFSKVSIYLLLLLLSVFIQRDSLAQPFDINQKFQCVGNLRMTRVIAGPPTETEYDFINFVPNDIDVTRINAIPGVQLNGSVFYDGFLYLYSLGANEIYVVSANYGYKKFTLVRTPATGSGAGPDMTGFGFNNGGVTKNGRLFMFRNGSCSGTNGSVRYYEFDLALANLPVRAAGNLPTNQIIVTNSEQTAVGLPQASGGCFSNVVYGDVAIDPITDDIFLWFHPNPNPPAGNIGLFKFNPVTRVLTHSGTRSTIIMGTLFFDDKGKLYGYGSPPGGGNQDRFYSIDKLSGRAEQYGTPDIQVSQSDGCSCPFRVTMTKTAFPSSMVLSRCSDAIFQYTYTVNNYTGSTVNGGIFRDTLDSRLEFASSKAALESYFNFRLCSESPYVCFGAGNPTGGNPPNANVVVTLSNHGGGTNNVIAISGLNIPNDKVTFQLNVFVNGAKFPAGGNNLSGQAFMDGLSFVLGSKEPSSTPNSFAEKDKTIFSLNILENCPLPVANTFTNAPLLQTNKGAIIAPMSASDVGGSISNYRIKTLDVVTKGRLFYCAPASSTCTAGTYTQITGPITLTAAQAASLYFVPTINYIGDFIFTFDAQDNDGNWSNTATYTVPTVPSIPKANSIVTVNVAASNAIDRLPTLKGGDYDGTIASYTITEVPASPLGTLSYCSNGTYPCTGTYTTIPTGVGITVLIPAQAATLRFQSVAGSTGNYVFKYRATDNTGNISNEATYMIPISATVAVAIPPLASNVTCNFLPNNFNVTNACNLAGTDIDGTVASYTITSLPPATQGVLYVNGVAATVGMTVSIADIGNITFDPAVTFIGNTSFTYTATDNAGLIGNTATYTLQLINVAPVAITTRTNVVFGSINNKLTELSGSDRDGSAIPIPRYEVTVPNAPTFIGELKICGSITSGTPTGNMTDLGGGCYRLNSGNTYVIATGDKGRLQYTPPPTFTGDVLFTYKAFDNNNQVSPNADYLIRVDNQAPTTNDIRNAPVANNAGRINLSDFVAVDPDGTIASFTISTIPNGVEGYVLYCPNASGTCTSAQYDTIKPSSLLPNGLVLTQAQMNSLQFDPSSFFVGNASFTYFATDNNGNISNPSTVFVPIYSPSGIVNVPPIALNINAPAIENYANTSNPIPLFNGFDYEGSLTAGYIANPNLIPSLSIEGCEVIILSLPNDVDQGTLFYSDGIDVFPVEKGFKLGIRDIAGLFFVPKTTFVGVVNFGYQLVDPQQNLSNVAIYSIPVKGGYPPTAISVVHYLSGQPMPNTNGSTPIFPLKADDIIDGGVIVDYTILSTPSPATGILYFCDGACIPVTPGLVIPNSKKNLFQFDPVLGYEGVALFNYYATDNSNLNSSTATYSIPIRTLYPIADDIMMTRMNNTLPFNITPLSASDADGSIQTYYINSLPPASQGTLSCSGCPVFSGAGPFALTPAQAANLIFTPVSSFIGVVTFNYSAIDNLGNRSNEATVTIPTAPVVIPVYFVSVKAQNEGGVNNISWNVVNNGNVSKYYIQRMLPNGEFIDIATVTNNPINSNYSYRDASFGGVGNVVYYRITLETDNRTKLQSEIVAVRLNENGFVSIWPNPVQTNLFVSLKTDAVGTLQFKLFNAAGQVVKRWNNVNVNQGNQVITLDGFEKLNSGMYIIKAFDNNGVEKLNQRLVKKD